jgi:UvrD-like helicase C-terminal domain/AAA domain
VTCTAREQAADGSAIEWTEATWNPVTGCERSATGSAQTASPHDRRDLGRRRTLGHTVVADVDRSGFTGAPTAVECWPRSDGQFEHTAVAVGNRQNLESRFGPRLEPAATVPGCAKQLPPGFDDNGQGCDFGASMGGGHDLKTLGTVVPTAEQLTVIDVEDPGFWLIQGAAGSGKTTTALLRLKFLVSYWRQRREDLGLREPVRVLVLTFNRTLRGYIEELTRQQVASGGSVELEVMTFAAWASQALGAGTLPNEARDAKLWSLANGRFPWPPRFLHGEVDYVLGRWMPEERGLYLEQRRVGRGASPQVNRALREQLLKQVIEPYEHWKIERGVRDWSDLAVAMARHEPTLRYDIVIVDETQDFSANQVRAIVRHLADDFVCTFVRDTTQRIYPNYFAWGSVGIEFGAANQRSRRLSQNHRNTRQIAAFARPLVEGIEQVEDESLPDFTGCSKDGPMPVVLRGSYSQQLDWTVGHLRSGVVAGDETIAFLHPKGGGWFSTLRGRLEAERIDYCELSQQAEWPDGDEQVALSTMHSSKGLEFDHVILLGYGANTVEHGEGDQDALLETHRRLLAMAVGRARKSVIVGYKQAEAPRLVDYLENDTYQAIDL